ncbi:tyrosine-type recombinase/integrase [Brevibacillus daliensis]|uniref:tyrosine-type recombinase/integrase n=1 Tax=Brevibacillus daliensis TaxID=2892995 RepID=UPI001E484338|nr:tyrosine-type recombinase/integrase [Brevibacillus daliensis]
MTAKFNFISRVEPAREIDLDKQIRDYLAIKKSERRSPRTIEAYAQCLSQFVKWATEREFNVFTPDIMREYISYLTYEKEKWDDHPTNPTGQKGLSTRTVNNNIRNLRVFFNHLVSERIMPSSPMDNISYQTQDKETFEIFSDDDVLKLLGAPNKRVYTGLRDYVMILVLCDTGCRVGELTNLKISDIDLKLRQISIRAEISKTRTARTLPISIITAKEIEQLINFMNVDSNDYLWLTQFGARYFADTFSKMLKKYAKKAGITGVRVSPHTFRHYFAIKFLRQHGEPIALMRILGHTSITMTEKYVRYANRDLSEYHEVASPVTSLLDKGNQKKRGNLKFR